jgi:hypothetical protein
MDGCIARCTRWLRKILADSRVLQGGRHATARRDSNRQEIAVNHFVSEALQFTLKGRGDAYGQTIKFDTHHCANYVDRDC